MHASESFLNFILDDENDIHFTDSLIVLEAKPFVWYELRRRNAARNILLFELGEDGQLRIDVFDSESEAFLLKPQRSQRSSGRWQSPAVHIACRTLTLAETQLTEEGLLNSLLTAASAKSSDHRTALVFTADAFDHLCRRTDHSGASQLTKLLKSPAGKCLLYIRLPLRADLLEQILLSDVTDNTLLTQIYHHSENPQEELLSALEAPSGGHLLRFDRCPGEMLNLLLRQAFSDPGSRDTLQELTAQAKYLELCRLHRIGPLAPNSPAEQHVPLSRRSVAALVRNAEFREALRRELTRCPSEEDLEPIQLPVYDDELARLAQALSLPDTCPQKSEWDTIIARIRRNLTTLWNKPRNPVVLQASAELCRSGRSAILRGNWNTLEEILVLLDFFAQHVCAPSERDQALISIRDDGRKLIPLSNHLYDPRTFGKAVGLDAITNMGIEAGEESTLTLLKTLIRWAIQRFDRPDISSAGFDKRLAYDREQIYEEIRARQDVLATLRIRELEQQQQEQQSRNAAALTSGITIDSVHALEPDDFSLSGDDDLNWLDFQ